MPDAGTLDEADLESDFSFIDVQIFRSEGFEMSSLQTFTAVTGFSFALLEACPVLRHLKGAQMP